MAQDLMKMVSKTTNQSLTKKHMAKSVPFENTQSIIEDLETEWLCLLNKKGLLKNEKLCCF